MKLLDFIPPVFRRGTTAEDQPGVVVSNLVASDHSPIFANYEAARFTNDRSWLPGYAQDARQDMEPGQRTEILRKARYFEKNHALEQKFLELIETNVVGTGITPTPASKDAAWNAKALEWFTTWMKFADLTSRQNFASLQAVIARAQAVDGEIFIYLTHGESVDGNVTGRPRLRLIESHRVVSANIKKYRDEGYQETDGILLDDRGRPAFYIVGQDADAFSGAKPRTAAIIPADRIIHVFEPSRAGQYRGLSLFHSVLHTLHDLDDLQRYEMLAAKDASSRANIVYTENGLAPAAVSPIGRSLTQPGSAPSSDTDRQTYLEKAFGGKTVYLGRNERWDQAESQRPSAAMREFWEYLTDMCCKGVGISYAAVSDYKGNWGGASLRGAVTSDNRFYEIRTQSLAAAFQRVYEFAIGWAIGTGELTNPPDDWMAVRWQPPRRASVDIGHESAAILNELRAGVRTYRDVLGEMGLDWRDVLLQRAIEEQYIDELAARLGVDREKIAALDPNERASAQAARAAEDASAAAQPDAQPA